MTKYQTIGLRFPERFFNHLYRSFALKAFLFDSAIFMQNIRIFSEVPILLVKSDTLYLNIKF
ncbi:hypothetical protein GCM10008119_18920 [Pedobacter mendelii]|uniref:Uncharacterized protein n=1 Tax=Pedobacter mendelii TaxID=1908240 RepID=A0ABQ2BGS8_9SPHI|nr:hypothetical protein GCM10008119_18920 [Pedobacter mendelii]